MFGGPKGVDCWGSLLLWNRKSSKVILSFWKSAESFTEDTKKRKKKKSGINCCLSQEWPLVAEEFTMLLLTIDRIEMERESVNGLERKSIEPIIILISVSLIDLSHYFNSVFSVDFRGYFHSQDHQLVSGSSASHWGKSREMIQQLEATQKIRAD